MVEPLLTHRKGRVPNSWSDDLRAANEVFCTTGHVRGVRGALCRAGFGSNAGVSPVLGLNSAWSIAPPDPRAAFFGCRVCLVGRRERGRGGPMLVAEGWSHARGG